MTVDVLIQAASAADAESIAKLLAPYAEQGLVLPRPAAEIRAHAADFLVALDGDRLVGTVSLRDFGNGLVEIRSLAVARECSGTGIGSRLIREALVLARDRGAQRVFALTLRPRLFERCGFSLVSKDLFPEKVWSDCVNCPKVDCCDEVAVLYKMVHGYPA